MPNKRFVSSTLVAASMALAVICTPLAPAAHAGRPPSGPVTIYVDAANIDDRKEDGSSGHPFDTIQEGIDAAQAHDTVIVRDGIYYETQKDSLDYGVYTSMQILLALKPFVAVMAENPGGAIIDGDENSSIIVAVLGFFKGHPNDGNLVTMDGLVFDGFVIRNFYGTAFWSRNITDGNLSQQTVLNEVRNLTIEGIDKSVSGGINIYFAPTRISGNNLSNVSLGITGRGANNGMRYVINGNRLDNIDMGIDFSGYTGTDVYNNIVSGFSGSGINGTYATGNIINNTLLNGAGSGVTGGSGVVKNNIFANCGTTGVNGWGDNPSIVDSNLYWNNGPTGDEHRLLGSTPVPLAPNEVVADPGLDADGHIGEFSPAIDGGLDYSSLLCDDIDGDPRCTSGEGDGNFDLGADERAQHSCTTVYVDVNNSSDPSENGSDAHPFDTIQEGIDAALACDTVIVRDGVYYETQKDSLDYGVYTSMQILLALKPFVAVMAENPGGAVIDGDGNRSIIVAVLGFFKGHPNDGNLVTMDGLVFDGFVIRNFYGTAFWSRNIIDGVLSQQTVLNEVRNLTIEGIDKSGSGGINCYFAPTRISGNRLSNVGLGITGRGSNNGMRYVINGNRLDNVDMGIDFSGYTGTDVYNNIVSNFSNSGINGTYATGNIINNTLVDGTGSGVTGGSGVVKNNLFANCGTTGVNDWGDNPSLVDFNLYWNNGPTGDEHRLLGEVSVPLALNEIIADPLLDTDGHIGEYSPAIDGGLDYSSLLCVDIDGDPRCTSGQGDGNFDLGADEYATSTSTSTCTDDDGDGYFAEEGCGTEVDCDDSNPQVNPGMNEKGSRKNDDLDNDCNGIIDG